MDFTTRLKEGPVLVADGAMGTLLQSAGLPIGKAPEAWLLEQPDAVAGVHRAYVDAGAELILTCTFGGTRARLKHNGLDDRVAEISRKAVEVARGAAAGDAYVAGDIGPLGELMAPMGLMTPEVAEEMFAEQAEALAGAGVDLIYIETMAAMEEIEAAVRGAQRVAPHIPLVATMSFDTKGRTNMGVRPANAAQTLAEMGVLALGANCGASLEMTEQAVREIREAVPDGILVVKPNAGLPQMTDDGEVEYDGTPEILAGYAAKFVELGARIVGGCCGSTPDHIRAIAQGVKQQ